MSKTGSVAKVKLNSFDDLFGTEQPQTGTEQVQMMKRWRRLQKVSVSMVYLYQELQDQELVEDMS